MTDNRHIRYLNALRVVATLFVVLIHTSSGGLTGISGNEWLAYGFYKYLGTWAVPVFVMISGSLFLSSKNTSYRTLLSKYIRRIVLALILFGLPMCLCEAFITGEGGVFSAVLNFLCGHSWAHMWYLYMLIGLYLLTPVVKPFVNQSSKRNVEVALLVLFVMSSLLPSLKKYGLPIDGWMMLPPYLFYYILGYYMAHLESWKIKSWHCFLAFALFIVVNCFRMYVSISNSGNLLISDEYSKYYDVNTLIGALAVFLLFKRLDIKWDFADRLRIYCFAIYIIHPVFINLAYKFVKLHPSGLGSPWSSLPLFLVVFFAVSLFISFLLNKIPWLRKYVL